MSQPYQEDRKFGDIEASEGESNLVIDFCLLTCCVLPIVCLKDEESLESVDTFNNFDVFFCFLQSINLAGNNIRSLAGLEDHPLLENVDLEDNEVRRR